LLKQYSKLVGRVQSKLKSVNERVDKYKSEDQGLIDQILYLRKKLKKSRKQYKNLGEYNKELSEFNLTMDETMRVQQA
jgi:vacuolar-type H+-ATPase subunit I/STV1